MKLSLRQAAVETGKSKSTILRSIQSGRLSAERLPDNGYAIDPSELFRVYDPRNDKREPEGQDAPGEILNENALLQAQIDALRETVRRLDDQVSDLKADREDVRKDRDHWRSQAEISQRLLTDEREKVIVPAPAPAAVARAGLFTRVARAIRG